MTNDLAGGFFIGFMMGMGGGIAIGFAIALNTEIKHIMELLKQFKSEGKDDKWLK